MIAFTEIPKKGDIVVGELSSKEVKYIPQSVFVFDEIDANKYEIIGVVGARRGNEVLIVYKTNTSRVWCNTFVYKLSGYTLDGTDRTGTLALAMTNNSSTKTSYDFPYNATMLEDFVAQLNETFASIAEDRWRHRAYIEDDVVYIAYDFKFWQQGIKASNGFTVEQATLSDIPYNGNIYRRNGYAAGNGSVSSWERFAYYYRNKSATLTSNVTSINRSEAICLADYLGNSTDGIDHCKWLRGVFGEGEDGWLKHLESFIPVKPCDYGDMSKDVKFAMNVKSLLKDRVNDKGEIVSPAFNWMNAIATDCIPNEEWYLPTVRDLSDILFDVKYGINSSNTADALNKGLNLIKGTQVSNTSHWWSSCRSHSTYAWLSSGSGGYFYNIGMCVSCGVLPVSLQRLRMQP